MAAFAAFKLVVYLYVVAAGLLIFVPLAGAAATENRRLAALLAALYAAMAAGIAYLFWRV